MSDRFGGSRPERAGGWLALLCVLLVVWGPLAFGVRASRQIGALSSRGLPLGAVLALDLVATACGAAAGLTLARGRSIGIPMAKTALVLGLFVALLSYTSPWVPNNLVPGDTIYYVAASLAYHSLWLIYLFRSSRVRALQRD